VRQTILVIACVAAIAAGGCKGRDSGSQSTTATETIKPVAGQPAATNTDDALTQTVDPGDNRSEAEGGGLTENANVKTDTAVAAKRKTAGRQKAEGRRQK